MSGAGGTGGDTHVLAIVGAPAVLHQPVVLAILGTIADDHYCMIDGRLTAGRVKDAALVSVPVLRQKQSRVAYSTIKPARLRLGRGLHPIAAQATIAVLRHCVLPTAAMLVHYPGTCATGG